MNSVKRPQNEEKGRRAPRRGMYRHVPQNLKSLYGGYKLITCLTSLVMVNAGHFTFTKSFLREFALPANLVTFITSPLCHLYAHKTVIYFLYRSVNLNIGYLNFQSMCHVIIFFLGIGCLFPFLPLHMTKVGLSIENVRFVSMVSPAVAILGPLIAGPIADKLAGHQSKNDKSSTGRYLRVMIAVACIFSALFYSLLVLIPTVDRALPPGGKGPDLKFNCDRHGAMVRLIIDDKTLKI
jgi:hypothetical protein